MKALKASAAPRAAAPGIYRPMATTSNPIRQAANAHIFQKAAPVAAPPKLPKY